MISLPCVVDDPSLGGLFPTAISLFEFANGYQTAASMEVGKGYWLNLSAASTASISGMPETSISVDSTAGWSMVGPGKNTVAVSSLGDHVISVFGFDAGYFTTDALDPGKGYWANLSTAGALDLSGAPAAKPVAGLPKEEISTHAVLWAEAAGRQQMIHLGVEANEV